MPAEPHGHVPTHVPPEMNRPSQCRPDGPARRAPIAVNPAAVSTNAELGRTLVRAGWLCLLVAGAAPVVSMAPREPVADLAHFGVRVVAGLVAMLVFGVVGGVTVSYGRRLQVRPGEPIVADKGRPLVLFLRSFSADSQTVPGTEACDATRLTPEEHLQARLSDVGEMIAIGRPGEFLPPIGAPRIYPDDDSWQTAVLDLMQRSRLTVLAFGSSPGLRWEVYRALEHVHAERLLLWFPTRDTWHRFRAFAQTDPGWTRALPSTAADVHLLAFYASGTPRVLEVHWTEEVGDFSATVRPDVTKPGDVSPGGLIAYLEALSSSSSTAAASSPRPPLPALGLGPTRRDDGRC